MVIESSQRISAHNLHDSVNQKYGKVHPYGYHLDMVADGVRRFGYAVCDSEEDIVLAEYGASIVGMEIQRSKVLEQEEDDRERNAVQVAISTLSFSEIEAAIQIFAELEENEGLLVASKIADRSGITRSVIVNALRKLESAGVIESRSLGMKGTYIKILNGKLKSELEKVGL